MAALPTAYRDGLSDKTILMSDCLIAAGLILRRPFKESYDMAVLHQAFRCPVTPEFQSKISKLLAAWTDDDRGGLSALALAGFGALSQREDIHTAFYLHPDGAAASWMQPEFISPGLA